MCLCFTGDERWAYRDDCAGGGDINTEKVSLDPYRLESRRIMALVKACLPPNLQRVEKASVDEVFLDLSAHVHSILLRCFPELAAPSHTDVDVDVDVGVDASSIPLPMPSPSAVLAAGSWTDVGVRLESGDGETPGAEPGSSGDGSVETTDAELGSSGDDHDGTLIVDIDDEEMECADADWDDVCIMIGSQIVRAVRAEIFKRLGYTTSGGVASNKMISKLASAHLKPNAQTLVRTRAVPHFLSGKKLGQIRLLGGKCGERVTAAFGTEQIRDLLAVSLDQLQAKLGAETGAWVYHTIRGADTSEVNPRTQIKSMLSTKSFPQPVRSEAQLSRWLRIFAADIYARLEEEEGAEKCERRRRPRTLNLQCKPVGGVARSRSCSIPLGRPVQEDRLFEMAVPLLARILADAGDAPLVSLSMSVTGFEEAVVGNTAIGSFLVPRGGGGTRISAGVTERAASSLSISQHDGPVVKRQKLERDIKGFFDGHDVQRATEHDAAESPNVCPRCKTSLDSGQDMQSHQDWHMAVDMDQEERGRTAAALARLASAVPQGRGGSKRGRGGGSRRGVAGSRSGGGGGRLERGQGTLKFG